MESQMLLFPTEDLECSSVELLVRTSPKQDSAEGQEVTRAILDRELDHPSATISAEYSRKYNPNGSSLRMSTVCLPQTREEISPTSSWHWERAGTRTSHGEFLMLNMCEWTEWSSPCRRDEGVSSLSGILESLSNRLRRFFLSRIACEGIIRRSAKRGKPIPEPLKTGLEYMVEWWNSGC